MRYAVCRLIWASRGYNYKSVSAALQKEFPGREGLAASSLQRYVQQGDEAPPDVVEAIRSLPILPDCDPKGAEVVQLGLDALERGPVVDPDALAASLQKRLPAIDPQIIAAAVAARVCGSDELAKRVAAEVRAQQPDVFELAWKAAAEALAQEPKPPSAEDMAAKVVAALADQPKKMARSVARHLRRLDDRSRDQVPTPEAIARAVARRLAPFFVTGVVLFAIAVGAFLHYQQVSYQPARDGRVTIGHDGEVMPPLALGERRLPLWDWQDRPPCSDVAREVDGGCWIPTKYKPPCPKESWEKNGECWVPAAGRDQKRPPQAGDGPESPGPAQKPR